MNLEPPKSENPVLADLNPAQRNAVLHVDGPLLIFAGAGSGKTRVITHRIANLIYNVGIPAENILAVTFTNKASGEMRERLASLAGNIGNPQSAERVFFSTFHKFCAWLLRRYGEAVGVKKHFTIYDDADSVHLIKAILKKTGLEKSIYRPSSIMSIIDRAKNELRSPEQVESSAEGPVEEKAGKIYFEYERMLREAGALDFGDLLVYAVRLLQTTPTLLQHLQEKFAYILVDEYQDTNHAQYTLLRLLARHGNICVVGDDDQAIYSWRGADIRNILSFETDFPQARIVKLEENYRSTQAILDTAYRVIRNNRDRAEKRLVTQRKGGEAPVVYAAADGYDEAAFVAMQMHELASEYRLSDMAVFYRMSAQSRVIEEEMLARGIPYVVVSGVGFYERREVKDLIAYLRILANPADDAAFGRVLNVPKRGIGDTTAATLAAAAKAAGIPQTEMLMRLDTMEIPAAARKRLGEVAALLAGLREDVKTRSVEEVLRRIVAMTGYLDFLEKSDPATFEDRAANVQELYTVAQEFGRRAGPDASIVGFIEEMSLLTDLDRADTSADRVSLMTLHAAKGLEFGVVFLVSMEEGSLPHSSSFEADSEMEEERRLCYVGITRAKDRLFMSFAYSRRVYGEMFDSIRPSRFLEEAGMLENVTRVDVVDTESWMDEPRGRRPRLQGSSPSRGRVVSRGVERVKMDDETAAFGVSPGDRVIHAHFGEGTMMQLSGRGETATVTVCFDLHGNKRLKLGMANLKRLE